MTRKMVCNTPPSKDTSTHRIWNSYLKECKRYALDTIILETRSEVKVKVTVTQKRYLTLSHQKMHLHTKFEIPISKNIGDMHQTKCSFKKQGQRPSSRSQLPNYDTRHFVITRSILTTHLRFLPQIMLEICSGKDYSKN